MKKIEELINKTATINVQIKSIFGGNAHILVGGKVVSVPISKLNISNGA